MRASEIADGSQVGEARRIAVSQAQALGFGESDAGRVAIVVTELATNLLKHGSGGTMLIGSFDDATGSGVECLALDRGAGMADVSASMRDGHSTAGSPGTGLGAIGRGATLMEVYSRPGLGTAILARLSPAKRAADEAAGPTMPSYGAVAVPMAGETVSGDAWCHGAWPNDRAHDRARGWTAMMADGLGHGPNAAEAAHAAVRCFTGHADVPPTDMLAEMHRALRPTRGAAVSIAQVDPNAKHVRFAGVGNVAAALIGPDGAARRMVSNNGTVGHIARHMRHFDYPFEDAMLLVLASDGLLTGWRLEPYPGLLRCHPTLIAGVLYRDFNRGRDDVSILVCRLGTS